jgi:hypothetical protein
MNVADTELHRRLVLGQLPASAVAKAAADAGQYEVATDAWDFASSHPDGQGLQAGDVAELDTPLGQVVGLVVEVFEDAGQVSVRLLDDVTAPEMTLPAGTERTFSLDTVIAWATPPRAAVDPMPGDLVNSALQTRNQGPVHLS